MKKLIVVAAAVLAGSPAFASKARVNALGNSRQLVDVQYTFERPYLIHNIGELATIEWGAKGEGANPHAEGGFFKKADDSVYGLYFGRKSADFSAVIQKANAAPLSFTVLEEQNPINVFYGMKSGDLSWGATLKYSNGKNDASDRKVSTMGLAAGVTNGVWEAELVLGLVGKSEETVATNSRTVESKGNTKIGFGYNLNDTMHAYVDYKTVKIEGDTAAAAGVEATVEKTDMNLGFINTVVKNDDVNFFYGVAYSSSNTKDTEETSTLPVWMGIEANATSWMVMRASLQQNVLINTVTTKVANTPDSKADLDSIAFNVGAGIKLGKGMLDVSFNKDNAGAAANAGKGEFNYAAGGFLTQAAYTYNF